MMWQAIAYVGTGVTLAAFIAAAAAWLFSVKSRQKLDLIRSAPDAERASLVQDALEFFRVDTDGLTRVQKYELALTQIQARAARFRLSAIVVVIISVLAAAVTGYAISRTPAPADDSAEPAEQLEVKFVASGESEPFAIKGRFVGKASVRPGGIDVAVAEAKVTFPAFAPDGGDRWVEYLRAGLACSNDGRWEDVSQSQRFPIEETMTEGDVRDLGDFELTIPKPRDLLATGCWLVFNLATKLEPNESEVAFSHAHTRRDLF